MNSHLSRIIISFVRKYSEINQNIVIIRLNLNNNLIDAYEFYLSNTTLELIIFF